LLLALILIFAVAYAAIALEHPIGISKSASALFGAGLLWTVYAFSTTDHAGVEHALTGTLAGTAQIIFFLMGAMTIVEAIDAHDGFEIITSRIRTKSLTGLLWITAWLTFFLSAILDNLTTTIVMVSLIRKILNRDADRLLFASIIIIAANAGGAWSPIGDVTTTMLWIGGQVSALGIIKALFLASVVNLIVPLSAVTYRLRGQRFSSSAPRRTLDPGRNVIFALGLGILVLVPAFKQITHLPPFMGMLFGLGILWLASEMLHRTKEPDVRQRLTIGHALSRIDHSSLLFFTGILLAVATLEHTEVLAFVATWLDETIGRLDVIGLILGLLSAIVDNVPLVAAAMGMYDINQHPADTFLWEFVAYCAGTGGSILIIGSAAGVAAMGIEKIQFIWYARKIAWLAMLGYFAGAAVYIVQYKLVH
jgi:NhaD family Na+/H+ antiporter